MSDFAIINIDNKQYKFPIIIGTCGDKAIDISQLRNNTQLITIDPGFKNTGAAKSSITFIDGEKGELFYRGYPIEQLAEKCNYLEVSYLLLNGELPNHIELEQFSKDIKKHNLVNEEMLEILHGFPRSAHSMGMLSSLSCALTAFNPDAVNAHSEKDMYLALVKLLAQFPILATWIYRKKAGLPPVYADNNLNYTANILKMLFSLPTEFYEVCSITVKALNTLLILHADHEQNCSTSTVRLVCSAQAGLFASISAGVSALWGRLHGGANQAVIEMCENILKTGDNLKKWIDKAKNKNDPFRLMGFGHRVYKNFDPRAKILKKTADEIFKKFDIHDPILELAKNLEKIALEDSYFIDKKLYPNVDFYSGIIYQAIGIPKEMFSVMFAVGRLPGWMAHWKEIRLSGDPIGRPRQIYVGPNIRSI